VHLAADRGGPALEPTGPPESLQGRLKPLYVQNRKYIGSKYHLLPFIEEVVERRAPDAETAVDLFAGSGVVAYALAARGLAVTAVDNLYHNWVAAQCFLGGRPGEVDWERVQALLVELDQLPPAPGYCAEHFGGTYFMMENAARIDAIRERLADWSRSGAISAQEEAILLTSLLYAADKVANTCGQYDAYLKHLGAEPYSPDGVHRVDAMVYRPLALGLPQVLETGRCRAICGDADQLVDELECDLLYLDPPYNQRQYIDNYHVLENIARWEKPPLRGKTRKFPRDHLKSPYSSRRLAGAALDRLLRRVRCRHILLSYNNEGIVPDEVILAALSARGDVEVFEREYAIFGNGAGRSGRRPIRERLFYCRVKRDLV
jgi:adenine-specific DNA-methyltransferase